MTTPKQNSLRRHKSSQNFVQFQRRTIAESVQGKLFPSIGKFDSAHCLSLLMNLVIGSRFLQSLQNQKKNNRIVARQDKDRPRIRGGMDLHPGTRKHCQHVRYKNCGVRCTRLAGRRRSGANSPPAWRWGEVSGLTRPAGTHKSNTAKVSFLCGADLQVPNCVLPFLGSFLLGLSRP